MEVAVENVGALGRKLTFKIAEKRFEDQVRDRLQHLSRTVRLNGFRPGRVPVQVIRQRFGDQVRGEVLSGLINEDLSAAFKQEQLRPVAQPTIDTTGKAEDGAIACVASFEVMPEFPEIDVSTLAVERLTSAVTDADVDAMIDTLRKQRQHFDPVERAAAAGDFVSFEYAAEGAGYRFPEQGLERAGTVLGSGNLFQLLDPQLTGRAAGEAASAEVAFPADYPNEHLAGKTATVQVRVEKVQAPVLPELDAAFISQFGIQDGDEATFRKEIRANLERELRNALGMRLKSEVAEKLAAAYPDLAVPEVMVENEMNALLRGRVPEGQAAPQAVLDELRPMARKRVAAALLMGELARKQEIKLDQARVQEFLLSIASTYEEPEQVVELYSKTPNLMASLHNRVMEEQVANWVAEHAQVSDRELPFAELMGTAGAA